MLEEATARGPRAPEGAASGRSTSRMRARSSAGTAAPASSATTRRRRRRERQDRTSRGPRASPRATSHRTGSRTARATTRESSRPTKRRSEAGPRTVKASPADGERGAHALEEPLEEVRVSVCLGERTGRRRVGLHPALAGGPRLDPGVGVAVAHDVEPAPLVGLRAHAQALHEAGRDALEAKENDGRAREVLAVAGLLLEQELGEGVSGEEGAGAEGVAVASLQVRDGGREAPAPVGVGRQAVGQRPQPLVDDGGQREAFAPVVVGQRQTGPRGARQPRAVERNRQAGGAPDAPRIGPPPERARRRSRR